jgi:hypothetical protein
MLSHRSRNTETSMSEMKILRVALLTLPLLVLSAACGRDEPEPAPVYTQLAETGPQAEFFAALQGLCGKAYEGRVTEAPPGDTTFNDRLVMHVRNCDSNVIRIPFHVGENRSRTWVITRLEDGMRLKHDHRHEDGSDDAITLYGGDTENEGTAREQTFPADEFTASLVPEATTNVWTLEIVPGELFVYGLHRVGTDRRFRIEFDLTNPVEAPPPPWGGS